MHSTLVVAYLDLLTYVDGVLRAPREPLKTPVVQKKVWVVVVCRPSSVGPSSPSPVVRPVGWSRVVAAFLGWLFRVALCSCAVPLLGPGLAVVSAAVCVSLRCGVWLLRLALAWGVALSVVLRGVPRRSCLRCAWRFAFCLALAAGWVARCWRLCCRWLVLLGVLPCPRCLRFFCVVVAWCRCALALCPRVFVCLSSVLSVCVCAIFVYLCIFVPNSFLGCSNYCDARG